MDATAVNFSVLISNFLAVSDRQLDNGSGFAPQGSRSLARNAGLFFCAAVKAELSGMEQKNGPVSANKNK